MLDASAVQKIAEALQVDVKQRGNHYRMVLDHAESGRRLSLEIYLDIPIGKKKGNLISVFTPSSHLQLHFCSGFVVSQALGEVTFVAINKGKLCGLIIEKEAGCSLFANVDTGVLSGDFTALGPEIMLSGIALSLTEGMLPKSKGKPAKKSSQKPRGRRSR